MKTNSDFDNIFTKRDTNNQNKFRISKIVKKNSKIYKLNKLPTENYENDENLKSNKTESKTKTENIKRRANRSILKTPSIGIKAMISKGINSPQKNKDKNIPLNLFKHLKQLSPCKTETDYLSKS